MITLIPSYFEKIRRRASELWDQLKQDPELAGPWHQLFMQVQSPMHVVSELLQNADDAGATRASVSIDGNDFVFVHDGEDFTEEHFASLCRFGYSNKRALHTIGFRGVGFKSTFSIGDEVVLNTPSLSVQFCRERFTEPVWKAREGIPGTFTEIRVAIRDDFCLRELEKNLEDWTKNPISLLFFQSIRCLSICGKETRWEKKSLGPVSGSQWMALSNAPDQQYLLIQSEPESFPEEAIAEIQKERMLTLDKEASFPPCKIEIVLGSEGRLFVILPTGVKTDLPFACNAPLIQDPARLKIKDPETSPTNRWLLERIGKLSAKAMLGWLGRKDWNVKQRCEAYALLPDLDRKDHSIEGRCGCIVEEAFENTLKGQVFLLTEHWRLEREKRCLSVPEVLLDIWPSDEVQRLFSEEGLPILSRHILSEHRRKLANWDLFDEISKDSVLDLLKLKQIPKPETWAQLLVLWAYVADELVRYYYYDNNLNIRIVPVQGKNMLFSAAEVVRLGEKKLLQSQEDWQFLSDYLLVLNQNWTRYLAEQRRKAEQENFQQLRKQVTSAYKILDALALAQTSDTSQIIQQVAEKFFNKGNCDFEDFIRLAQLAATLGATVSQNFQFITNDGSRRPASEHIICDLDSDLDVFVPGQWYKKHVLHEDYHVQLSCTKDEWRQWMVSGKSGLLTFVPLIQIKRPVVGRTEILMLMRDRGFTKEPYWPYVTNQFILDDWDYDEILWNYWKSLCDESTDLWGRLMARILAQPKEYWSRAISAKALQIATTGTKKAITNEALLPSWIIKFQALHCLRDTRGFYRQPASLLRRTPETEALLDVESFVRSEDDNEQVRPLLIALGVGDTPTGPDRLFDRLRALATTNAPPIYEVEKWCSRLDQIITRCPTDEFQHIKSTFTHNKLIFTSESEWARTVEVFLNADDDDAPGAAVIHPAIGRFAIWNKIGVAERPTADLSLKWLASIESNKKLTTDQLRRVRMLLPRYADRIWLECRHWLNLEGEWVPVERLEYKLTMQTLTPWSNLFLHIKQKTADLQKLSADRCIQYPFSDLPTLADSIEERFDNRIVNSEKLPPKPWLNALGQGLKRIVEEGEIESSRICELGQRLEDTKWCFVDTLQVSPYIKGTPSGTPRLIEVLWKDKALYVKRKSIGKMAKAIAQELGRAFGRPDIVDAIKICFERDQNFIDDYLHENFKLKPIEDVIPDKMENPDEKDAAGSSNEMVGSPETAKEPIEVEDKTTGIVEISYPGLEDSIPEKGDFSGGQKVSPSNEPEPRRQSQGKPKLMEIFARAHGYVKHASDNIFIHGNGSRIKWESGNSFPWKRYSASGELMQCYWTKNHCIECSPIEIDADVWELCIKYPDEYTLILTSTDGSPSEYSGKRVCELKDNGQLTLFPASFRIVYGHDS